MAKIDISKIDGYADMTPEQKIAALEAFETEDPDYSGYVKKDIFDKTASELAAKKKELNEKLTEDEQKMYTITLANGKKLTGLDMNGTNYVSKEKVDETIFKDNLSTMKVSDGETETTYTDMVFIQQMEWADGTFYLAFREKTKEEKLVAALNATSNSITDIQVALAEVYEMVLGGN